LLRDGSGREFFVSIFVDNRRRGIEKSGEPNVTARLHRSRAQQFGIAKHLACGGDVGHVPIRSLNKKLVVNKKFRSTGRDDLLIN
jgi:hypothetical protein